MLDPDRSAALLVDRHQIEAARAVMRLSDSDKIPSRMLDPPPLIGSHGVSRIRGLITRARLDFDEDEEFLPRTDQVDLAGHAPVVPRENAESLLLEKAGGTPLATRPQSKVSARLPPQPTRASL